MAVPKKRVSHSRNKQALAHDYATVAAFAFNEEGNLVRPHRTTKKNALAKHVKAKPQDKQDK